MKAILKTQRAELGNPTEHKVKLLWTDPPYGTGKIQDQGGRKYFDPADVSYVLEGIKAWLPSLTLDGVVIVCCDYRLQSSLVTMMRKLDWEYMGDIIWSFGLGRPRTSWWPVRHNNLCTFRQSESALFDRSQIPRERRLAKKKGYTDDKPSGSVWDFTMSNTHPDRVGYPNQKPLEIVTPFILAHTKELDWVADPFFGSGTTAVSAIRNRRNFVGTDINPEARLVTAARLSR